MSVKISFQKITLLFVVFFFAHNISAQQTGSGIELFEKGDYPAAAAALINTNDNKELYYLALSYEKLREPKKAQEALIKCVAGSYAKYVRQLAEWQNEKSPNKDKPLSEFLKTIQTDIEVGYLAAKKALELDAEIFKGKDLVYKAEALRKIVLLAQTTESIYAKSDKSLSPYKITEKPRAEFPPRPFMKGSSLYLNSVTISFLVVFGADGVIKLMIPAEPSIDPFTLEGLKAGAKIKFKPATIDKKPVSSYGLVSYAFTY